MRKPAAYLFAILVGAIIWFFFQHFKLEGTDLVRVVPKTEEELNGASKSASQKSIVRLPNFIPGFKKKETSDTTSAIAPASINPAQVQATRGKRSPNAITIGSFHLHFFGASAADPSTIEIVAKIVQQFDIVALQGISPTGVSAVMKLAERAGGRFDVVMGAPVMVQHHDQHLAYIFNRETILADRGDGLYTLGDPDNLLHREPLVGWFRAKAAPADEAFTFTLVNVDTELRRVQQELGVLDNAMHEIRNDGRDEDDVIMLGSFQAPSDQLGQLGEINGLVTTIRKATTDLMGKSQTENILFSSPPTDEFTGRAGVFQYLRAFNLTSTQAREISDYLPVWAEFSIYEGGHRSRVASSK